MKAKRYRRELNRMHSQCVILPEKLTLLSFVFTRIYSISTEPQAYEFGQPSGQVLSFFFFNWKANLLAM